MPVAAEGGGPPSAGESAPGAEGGPPAWLTRAVVLALLAAWTAGIFWLLTTPRVSTAPRFWGRAYAFNLGHAVLFGVEALLVGAALRPGRVAALSGRWLAAALIATAYGALMEWLQGALTTRQPSLLDVATNAAGAFGVPWALARPRPLWRRPLLASLAAAACAALATWARG